MVRRLVVRVRVYGFKSPCRDGNTSYILIVLWLSDIHWLWFLRSVFVCVYGCFRFVLV